MARSRDTSKVEDLEALRQRFQEFLKANRPRTRLPEELWNAAAEISVPEISANTGRSCRIRREQSSVICEWFTAACDLIKAGGTVDSIDRRRCVRLWVGITYGPGATRMSIQSDGVVSQLKGHSRV